MKTSSGFDMYYTIPSDNRELQLEDDGYSAKNNYTIPSDNRELQRNAVLLYIHSNYTIPSDNRELQLMAFNLPHQVIIPYQVITGNYNASQNRWYNCCIIPYQVITGNYNKPVNNSVSGIIIPYQVITGNYNYGERIRYIEELYHTK